MIAEDSPALSAWLRSQRVAIEDIDSESAFGSLASRLERAAPARGASPRSTASHTRVLMLLCQKPVRTGSGVVVREVVNGASSRGVRFTVVCGSEPGDDPSVEFDSSDATIAPVHFNTTRSDGLPFPVVGMSDRMPYDSVRFADLSYAQLCEYLETWRQHIRSAVAIFKPHVIHVHHLWLLVALCALESPSVPMVVSLHGTDLHQAVLCPHLADLVRRWSDRCGWVVALTKEMATTAQQMYPLIDDRCVVLGNGFNDSLFFPQTEPRADVLSRYGLSAGAGCPHVVFVGKFVEWKGVEWLLRAFASLNECRGATLTIAGSGPAVELQRYRRIARILGIENQVRFPGHLRYEDVCAVMNTADVFVLPSVQEPFGLVLLEAMACGLRVVGTDQAGPREFVPSVLRERRDAILVPGLPGIDPTPDESAVFVDALASAIREQLAKPLPWSTRLEISGAVGHLRWTDYVGHLLKIYQASGR
jgi:glycosyltransferase involved in cell wall biosynthesis